ncbi:MAG: tRNA (N6-threonylcarbamoyladenosine(37)-N6)-methyltransferase TrmO [Clostridia bacterium]|nr:tRNA (N6-threonylcarbamoyladenosine(37)-N6)-methyltransferase TrmO [Clostridia bacterium]
MELKIIARIYTDFDEKFGIPRQSGICKGTVGRIVFEKEYRRPEALRGIDGYSHLWLIWQFSESVRDDWSPTVRPPRLGGNKRMGVFATRSPFRPNPIGLSSVELLGIEHTVEGEVLVVGGADILNGTPIYDIKPYLKFTDCHDDAMGGFADGVLDYRLEVDFPNELLAKICESKRDALITLLSNDPRPSYKNDGEQEYGMSYAGYEVRFKVENKLLSVTGVDKR